MHGAQFVVLVRVLSFILYRRLVGVHNAGSSVWSRDPPGNAFMAPLLVSTLQRPSPHQNRICPNLFFISSSSCVSNFSCEIFMILECMRDGEWVARGSLHHLWNRLVLRPCIWNVMIQKVPRYTSSVSRLSILLHCSLNGTPPFSLF